MSFQLHLISLYDYIYAKPVVGSEDVELLFRHIFAFLKVKVKRRQIENASKLFICSTDTVSISDDKYGRRLCYIMNAPPQVFDCPSSETVRRRGK